MLLVKVPAPAVDGAANAALLKHLARKTLKIPRRSVRLLRGERAREKTLEIDLDPPELRRRLAQALG